MRTKEKFYENLRKKHVSLEKRIERFEFRDVKTIEALIKKGDSLISKHKTVDAKYDKASQEYKDEFANERSLESVWDKLRDNFVKVKKENEKRTIDAQKKAHKAEDEFYKSNKKLKEADQKWDAVVSEVRKIQAELKGLESNLKSQISEFESGAKTLGVDVSSKLSKYKSAASAIGERARYIKTD